MFINKAQRFIIKTGFDQKKFQSSLRVREPNSQWFPIPSLDRKIEPAQ